VQGGKYLRGHLIRAVHDVFPCEPQYAPSESLEPAICRAISLMRSAFRV
jgi:hypothetical protein